MLLPGEWETHYALEVVTQASRRRIGDGIREKPIADGLAMALRKGLGMMGDAPEMDNSSAGP